MISDPAKEKAGASKTAQRAVDSTAVHLEIDGTMKLNLYPLPHPTESGTESRADDQRPSGQVMSEAGLRHIIRLQHQALSQQNMRIQQQRSMIVRLSVAVKRLREQPNLLDHNGGMGRLQRIAYRLKKSLSSQKTPLDKLHAKPPRRHSR